MIAILSALPEEAHLLEQQLDVSERHSFAGFEFSKGKLHGRDVILSPSGVGKVLSASITQHLIDTFPIEAIFFVGLAGGVNPSIEVGDVVLGERLIQHDVDATQFGFEHGQIPFTDMRYFIGDETLLKLAKETAIDGHAIMCGCIATGDQFIDDATVAERIRETLGADALEMEGASVAMVAHLNQIPHLVIRTISDKANADAKQDFNAFLKIASRNAEQVVKHVLTS